MPTMESCVEVFIPATEAEKTVHDNKVYTLEKIKDLQSKLVLVAPKSEMSVGMTVQNFLTVSRNQQTLLIGGWG